MKPLASLSLDLDNQWSYMKTHGDQGWADYPSYLGILLPRVLDFFSARDLRLTFFVVGQDASLDKNHEFLGLIGSAGHEVGNHSFHHEPWLHRYPPAQVCDELRRAHDVIEAVTGRRPVGFRGPGFSVNTSVLRAVQELGYAFDASTFPTYIGPLARAYYFMTARLSTRDREDRNELFGTVGDGLRPVGPYLWELGSADLLEIPVTTMPGIKVPFHLSYVLYLSSFSPAAALAYFRAALRVCRLAAVEPSLLLHPLDFLGSDEVDGLQFFPGMQLPGSVKRERVSDYLDSMGAEFTIVPMGEHAVRVREHGRLPTRKPDFGKKDEAIHEEPRAGN